jgi:hypothetical protein
MEAEAGLCPSILSVTPDSTVTPEGFSLRAGVVYVHSIHQGFKG